MNLSDKIKDQEKLAPIFILGISQRSGTNFLYDLIAKHPDCRSHPTVWEDFFVHYLDILKKYTDSVSRWKWKEGQVDDDTKVELCKYLGDGIIHFLSSSNPPDKRLLTKTPSVHNIHLFSRYFPHAYLLILVRDGRSVAESRVKSFKKYNETYETAMHSWAIAAKEIISFDKNITGMKPKYLIVKYEDLWNNVEDELKRIFVFLNLDIETYDFSSAHNLPVRGSSRFTGKKDDINWSPVEKTAEFNPLKRWSNWSRQYHEMFNALGSEYSNYFGYEEVKFETNKLYWWIWVMYWSINRVRRYYTRKAILSFKETAKRYLGDERLDVYRKYRDRFSRNG